MKNCNFRDVITASATKKLKGYIKKKLAMDFVKFYG